VKTNSPTEKNELYRHPNFEFGEPRIDMRRDEGPQKVTKAKPPQKEYPVGYTPPSKSALKNKKRREKRKAKETTGDSPVIGDSEDGNEKDDGVDGEGKETNAEKDLKSMKKKLRQIRQLKQRQASGEMLDDMQNAKIAKEAELQKKIQELDRNTQKST